MRSRLALWGEKAGLAMFCPISLSGFAAKRNYGKHESPYAFSPPRAPALGALHRYRSPQRHKTNAMVKVAGGENIRNIIETHPPWHPPTPRILLLRTVTQPKVG